MPRDYPKKAPGRKSTASALGEQTRKRGGERRTNYAMKLLSPLLLLLLLFCVLGTAVLAQAPQPDVPKGEVLHFTFDRSRVFSGTFRDYWVYVPAQYTPGTPACVYVNQDGIQWNAPAVFDNLIAKGEMPVTIGVFVMHGRVRAASGDTALDRFNRSVEYDGLGNGYARFLLDELLPDVETKKASDGRVLRLSHEGNDRAIGGSSSGAIAAFTAAWERPDAFSRVFSAIGTYVGLRGGDRYPTLIRKFEPKPLRVFLQDGSGDLNIYGGDWWMANQTMERALSFAGYDVRHVWGEGGHNGTQGTAVFPDAMRFLWKDWPRPVKAGPTRNGMLNDLLLPGEGWQAAAGGGKFTEGPAVNARGEVFFNDVPASKTYKIGLDGTVSVFLADSRRGDGQAFGPDGRLYAVAAGEQKIVAYDAKGQGRTLAAGLRGNDLVVAHNGNVYVTQPGSEGGAAAGKIWLLTPNGKKTVVDGGAGFPNGIALSPDQTLLYVDDAPRTGFTVTESSPTVLCRSSSATTGCTSPTTRTTAVRTECAWTRTGACTWRRAWASRCATRPGA